MRKKDLKKLIRHIALHSNYKDCGYIQMTTEQKALYDRVIGRESPMYEGMDTDQQIRYETVRYG